MTLLGRLLGTASVGAMLLACGNAPGEEAEELGVTRQEVNACDETVPSLRAVDGFPAYAQCESIENGPIWSNNGIDTASSSQGQGWVRTQSSGGYQCTEFARRYLMFRWGIDYQHGDAWEWCEGKLPSTLTLATSPTHGDLIVFAPGSCGADATTGHIAVVDTVDMAGGKVTIVEQNQAGRRPTQQSCAACYLHAVNNDGSAGGSGPGAGGAGGAGAGAGGAAGTGTGGAASGGGAAAGGTTSATAGTAPAGGYPSGDPATGGAAGSSVVGASGAANAGASGSLPGVGGAVAAGGTTGSAAASSSAGASAAGNDANCSVDLAASRGTPRGLAGWLLVGAALLRRRAACRLRNSGHISVAS